MNAETVTVEAFGALRAADFVIDAVGKLSISDAALTAALGRSRSQLWRSSCDIILPIPPPPPPPHGK